MGTSGARREGWQAHARGEGRFGCGLPSQWPYILLVPSQLLVISTLPPHTQVALTRPVQAVHNSKRLRSMVVWMVSDAVPKNREVAGIKWVADQRNCWTPQARKANRPLLAPAKEASGRRVGAASDVGAGLIRRACLTGCCCSAS